MYLKTTANRLDVRSPGLWLVNVTSQQARRWLEINVGNRRIRKHLTEYLRRQIESGEWQSGHPQPIVFSDTGRLIDGQHRLTAIADANLSEENGLPVRIETGAADCLREYLDTGISRTLDDRVQLDPDPRFNKFAAELITYEYMLIPGRLASNKRPTPEEAKELFAIHKTAIARVFELHRRDRGVGQVSVTFAAMEYFERDAEKAEEFYTDLFIPAGNVQQAQMLRDFVLRIINSAGGATARKIIYGKAIGCMKAHLEGREVKRVVRADSW